MVENSKGMKGDILHTLVKVVPMDLGITGESGINAPAIRQEMCKRSHRNRMIQNRQSEHANYLNPRLSSELWQGRS